MLQRECICICFPGKKLLADFWHEEIYQLYWISACFEKAKLGDNAQARLDAVTLWTQNNFTEEEFGAIQNLASTAEGIGVLEKIMEMQKNSSLSGHATQPATLNQDDLDEMMRDPRYWKTGERDQNFVNKVTDGFNKLYGS